MRNIRRLLITSAALLAASSTYGLESSSKTTTDKISIDIPQSSLDGSFVVKVSANKNEQAGDTHVELWRSFNGGQYQLVSSQPQFHAVSQMLHRQGTYAYQARIVNERNAVQSSSSTSFIDVSVRFPQLAN